MNGQLKQCFRIFDKRWPNQSIPHMMTDIRIACAILNVYHPGIESDVRDGLEIAESMLARLGKRNLLAQLVSAQGLNRKSADFETLEGSSIEDFPLLAEADLRSITLGSFQRRQVLSYNAEHIKTNGSYVIEVCKHVGPLSLSSHAISVEDPMLIRGRIQSWHRNSTRYFIYILINRARCGDETISGYCCSCPSGLRTVGCCSHITIVLWYLGLGQYLPEILIPAEFLEN